VAIAKEGVVTQLACLKPSFSVMYQKPILESHTEKFSYIMGGKKCNLILPMSSVGHVAAYGRSVHDFSWSCSYHVSCWTPCSSETG